MPCRQNSPGKSRGNNQGTIELHNLPTDIFRADYDMIQENGICTSGALPQSFGRIIFKVLTSQSFRFNLSIWC